MPKSNLTTNPDGSKVLCIVTECASPAIARLKCRKHYQQEYASQGFTAHKRRDAEGETSPSALARRWGIPKQDAWQVIHRNKSAAHSAVRYALSKGIIVKPAECQKCKKVSVRLQAHHPDYSKKLDVEWYCSLCHSIVHPHPNPYGWRGRHP